MKYPRPVMSYQELKKMGFSGKWLMYLYRIKNDGLAWKSGKARNSPILFDTEQLEKLRRAQCVPDY